MFPEIRPRNPLKAEKRQGNIGRTPPVLTLPKTTTIALLGSRARLLNQLKYLLVAGEAAKPGEI